MCSKNHWDLSPVIFLPTLNVASVEESGNSQWAQKELPPTIQRMASTVGPATSAAMGGGTHVLVNIGSLGFFWGFSSVRPRGFGGNSGLIFPSPQSRPKQRGRDGQHQAITGCCS